MKITFGAGDILRSKVLDPAWRSWQIIKVHDPVLAEDKVNLNIKFTFMLIDAGPDLTGKEVERTFSTKAKGMMVPLVAAIRGLKVSDIKIETFEVELDEFLNKKFDGFSKVETYNGNQNNKVEEYAPYKTLATGAGSPFNS